MKFRCHRGTLEDSLLTEIEITSIAQLIKILALPYAFIPLVIKDIQLNYYGYDTRVQQDLWAVKTKFEGYEDYIIQGFLYD